jgi:hypothetical protein
MRQVLVRREPCSSATVLRAPHDHVVEAVAPFGSDETIWGSVARKAEVSRRMKAY